MTTSTLSESGALARHLASLVKPRIVALLVVTGVAAVGAAGGVPPATLAAFALAGALVAAGSAALNCWYDRDLDRHMERTADRPLPSGDLDHRVALAFALGLVAAGTAVGLATLPAESVAYMLLGAASYAGLYTVGLKRRHWLGVVLGGSAGSFPVLAGWTVVRPLEPAALAMAALVFAWTPAHAWALAFVYRDDFRAADVPTLPAVASPSLVRRAVWHSTVAAVLVAAVVLPLTGSLYAATAAVVVPAFAWAFRSFRTRGSEASAVRAFFTSNLALALLFAGWALDGLVAASAPGTAAWALFAAAALAGLWLRRPALRGVSAARVPSPVRAARTGTRRLLARAVGDR